MRKNIKFQFYLDRIPDTLKSNLINGKPQDYKTVVTMILIVHLSMTNIYRQKKQRYYHYQNIYVLAQHIDPKKCYQIKC